jgi:PKD repeat protein
MKRIFTISLLTASLCAAAQPFSALYNFASVTTSSGTTDPTAPPTATGVTFGSFTAVGTNANPNANGRFSFVNWPTGATNGNDNFSSLTGSLSAGEYYEVTLSPATGYAVDLGSISFTVQRSSFGIRTWVVRSSLDGFSSNLAASITPANVNLSVQGTDTFFWNFDAQTGAQNGSLVTLGGPSFTGLTAPVIFRFYAWNSESGTGTFSIDNVTFNGTATALTILADFYSSPGTVCDGTPVQFIDTSQSFNGPITTYSWDFGDPGSGPANTSVLQNPAHTFSACGTYTVSLIVTNTNNNSDTAQQTLVVYCTPAVSFTGAPPTGCAPLCVNFTDNTTGNPANWNWNFGDNTYDNTQNPQHCYTSPGNYTISLAVLDLNGCTGSDTVTSYVTVNPAVFADYMSAPNGLTVLFMDMSTGGTPPYTYTFDPGDGSPVQNSFPASYTYPYDNIWTACLTVTDANGCSDSVCYPLNIVTTGISDAGGSFVEIFPNPSTDGTFQLRLQGMESELTIYNLIGEAVFAEKISGPGYLLDLAQAPKGTYFVKLKSGNETVVKKITID